MTDKPRGPWTPMRSGKLFFPFDPRPEEVDIEDIAYHLAHMPRFHGACSPGYNVADHSVRVAALCPPPDKLWGLVHDTPEAVTCDLPSWLKHHHPDAWFLRDLEKAIMSAICRRFGLPFEPPPSVKEADMVLRSTEVRDLLPYHAAWKEHLAGWEPLPEKIVPRSAAESEAKFLAMFHELTRTPT